MPPMPPMPHSNTRNPFIGRATALLAGTAFALAAPALAQGDDDGELPIRRLTLYRSGVGYFERAGQVTGDASVSLTVETDHVNDLLKSMVVLDFGGSVEGVSYGSREPLSRRLASFDIDLSGQGGIVEILRQIRGAEVEIEAAGLASPIRGRLVGTETRSEPMPESGDGSGPVTYINLATPMLRSVRLDRIGSIEIVDDGLRRELELALEALASQRDSDEKDVTIRLAGDGARRVRVSYTHEMPVWKASYRLVLPESPQDRSANVQGWAIVENTTGEDWSGVELALVSGQPVSFIMDLYAPLFLQRPTVPVPAIAGAEPRIYERGTGRTEPDRPQSGARRRSGGFGSPASGERAAFDRSADARSREAAASITADDMRAYGAAAAATAGESGEVFRYVLDAPVTLERRRSAMLPILRGDAESRRVSIYTPGEGGDGGNAGDGNTEHPMRGVELTNSTGLELMPGPISVFDGGSYAGDAQIGFVAAGETRLLSYAVDLEVSVRETVGSTQRVDSLIIESGRARRTLSNERTTTYAIDNEDRTRGRTVIIEHPDRDGWEMDLENATELETAGGVRRLEVELGPGGEREAIVTETRVVRQSVAVLDVDLDTVLRYQRDGRVSEDVAEAIRRAYELNSALQQARAELERLTTQRGELFEEQGRVRDNLRSVPRDSDLYRRYLETMGELEDEIETVRGKIEATRDRVAEAEQHLDDYLSDLSVR